MRRSTVLLLLALLAVLVAGCGTPRGRGSELEKDDFPAFVYTSAISLESYRLAVREGDLLAKLPCYCGCVDTADPPHRNLKECFIKPDGRFEEHGATCDLCGKIALDAVDLQAQGIPPREIRAGLDTRYRKYGKPTDTPWPL
jgi:predicted small secreted protein